MNDRIYQCWNDLSKWECWIKKYKLDYKEV